MPNSGNNLDKILISKIDQLENDQKEMLDKFIDVFLESNSKEFKVSKQELSKEFLSLADDINDYAYKHGMTEDFAKKLLGELS